MPPAKKSVQNDIDKLLFSDMVSLSFYIWCHFEMDIMHCLVKHLCVLLCLEIQEEQSSVSEGVSSEGMFFSHCHYFGVKIIIIIHTYMFTHCICAFQSLISFWKIGRKQPTLAPRQFAACHPPHPPHPDRRRNLPGNRTDHMTTFFHFEFEDKRVVSGCKCHHTHNKTSQMLCQSQVFSESTHTPDTRKLLYNQLIA